MIRLRWAFWFAECHFFELAIEHLEAVVENHLKKKPRRPRSVAVARGVAAMRAHCECGCECWVKSMWIP